MSDLGALSHHYKQSADLAKELNQAVTALKKQFYNLREEKPVPKQEMDRYRELLARVIDAMLVELSPSSLQQSNIRSEDRPELSIPLSISERLRRAHKGTMAYFLDDAKATKDRLIEGDEGLTQQDIQIMDELTATVGLDTAEVFRRMWRD